MLRRDGKRRHRLPPSVSWNEPPDAGDASMEAPSHALGGRLMKLCTRIQSVSRGCR